MRMVAPVLLVLVGLLVQPAATAHAGTYAGRIRWTATAGASVAGYRVYVRPDGGTYGAGSDVGVPAPDPDGVLSAVVPAFDVRTDYRVAVTAVGVHGDESARSNEMTIGYADVAALLDSDGDGLSDAVEDRNLNRVVDAGETDPERFDTDGDGIGDAGDACPGTPSGEAVSGTGCACVQMPPMHCDDGDPCNGTEECLAGSCQPGTPLVCNDGDSCTSDACVPGAGCTSVEQPGCRACQADADCPAPDGCAAGSCRDGRCAYASLPDGTGCGDGNPCNGIEACASGACRPGAPLACDDGNGCTVDRCDATRGCVHDVHAGCAACASSRDCDDANACTMDVCDGGRCGYVPVRGGACGNGLAHTFLFSERPDRSGAVSFDGATVGGEIYVFVSPEDGITQVRMHLDDPEGLAAPRQIENKVPYDLAGGHPSAANPFDTDTLSPGSHVLTAVVIRTDGSTEVVTAGFQVGAATCNEPGACDDHNPCTHDGCVPGVGCTHAAVPDGAGCDNGDPCDGAERCQSGTCTAGAPPVCDDGNACTMDACVSATGCTHWAVSDCRSCGRASDCDDGDPCTDEVCGAGRCGYMAADACGPEESYGLMLSGASDRSDAVALDGEVVQGDMHVFVTPTSGIARVRFYVDDPDRDGRPYQTEKKIPYDLAGGSLDSARAFDATDLDPGEHVITAEIKQSDGARTIVSAPFMVVTALLVERPPCTQDVDCDDGNPCTENTCDPGVGCLVARLPDASSCSDGVFCNGLETCWNMACRPGLAPECDDGNLCTEDACDEAAGRCAHEGIDECCIADADCADDDLCTEAERCEDGRCVSDPLHCPDGGACLDVACDPDLGCRTENAPGGAGCEDADPCTVTALCVGGACEATDPSRLENVDLRFSTDQRGERLLGQALLPPHSLIDPGTSGISIELVDESGATVYGAEVPGHTFSANRARSVFKYVGRAAAGRDGPEGLKKLVLRHRAGRMSVSFRIAAGRFGSAITRELTWVVRAGSTCASAVELECLHASRRLVVCR